MRLAADKLRISRHTSIARSARETADV